MRGLVAWGYHAELFHSPAACLNAVVTEFAACFVIDVHLGHEFGIDLSSQLSAMGIKAPVIHISGAGTGAIRRQALESGSVAFLDKPFVISKLVSIIEKATGQTSTGGFAVRDANGLCPEST